MSERLGSAEAISIRVLGPNLPASPTGLSVAHGSVTLLNPLTSRTHTIVITGGLVPTGNDHDRRQAGPLACCSKPHRDPCAHG
jgi:hypothetical protein